MNSQLFLSFIYFLSGILLLLQLSFHELTIVNAQTLYILISLTENIIINH